MSAKLLSAKLAPEAGRGYYRYAMDSYDTDTIAANLGRIREGIAEAATKAGRNPYEVALMAVSKFHPAEAVSAAYAAGIRLFGENRVQEAAAKFPPLAGALEGIQLHMIGTLQSNKINKAVGLFDGIQSVDSCEQLKQLLSRVRIRTTPIRLYFELHTGEDSKSGFPDEDSLFGACDAFAEWREEARNRGESTFAELAGLMTMAPFTADEARVRASFSKLRKTLAKARSRSGIETLRELSMGMSGDYAIAVEEGSTMLRIGTALFGARP